jgi:hypothetical protein
MTQKCCQQNGGWQKEKARTKDGSSTTLPKPLAQYAKALPINRQCLTRLESNIADISAVVGKAKSPRMQSNTADILAVFDSTSPIYRQCLTAHRRYIGIANIYAIYWRSIVNMNAQDCIGVTIALLRLYTADLSAMTLAVPGCFSRLLRVLYEIHHMLFKSPTISLASRHPYVLFPNHRLLMQ